MIKLSRVGRKPIPFPASVHIKQEAADVVVEGPKGNIRVPLHHAVAIEIGDKVLHVKGATVGRHVRTLAGTMNALISNAVHGVTHGFERKLQLVGVGYRAQVQGHTLNLSLGHSHPVNFVIPKGITIETPTQTEITVKGIDKQLVGQIAANIRGYRPVEPYKGKGVRYIDETVILKETKKGK